LVAIPPGLIRKRDARLLFVAKMCSKVAATNDVM